MEKIKSQLVIFILIILLAQFVAKSQISTNELPISFSYVSEVFQTNERMLKTMSQIDLETLSLEDKIDEKLGIPPRFGYPHEVDFTLENSGIWFDLPNGDKLWKLEIYCPGALSINLLYDKFWLPEGAKFFVYSSDKKHHIGAFTSNNNFGSKEELRGFATGLIYGERIVLEYYLPNEVLEQGVISVSHIVQGYRYINVFNNFDDNKKKGDAFQAGFKQSDTCHININCPAGQNWQKEKRAIAMIIVGIGNRWCTGSLINTTANDMRPYFLTADHCLFSNGSKADALYNPLLDHWSFYWHYESPGCISPLTDPINVNLSTVGATVIANALNDSLTDFALLRLSDDPIHKKGVRPYYLGWDRRPVPEFTNGVGIHHPNGDVKKISNSFQIFNYSQTIHWSNGAVSIPYTHWRADFNSGSMQGGSSGSPLLNNKGNIIGQVHGGAPVTCNTNYYAYYGRLSVSWVGRMNQFYRLSHHLDPIGFGSTTIEVLNGKNYCNETTISRVISQNEYVKCDNIIITNTRVMAGRKLTVETLNLNIGTDFVVEEGAEFEVIIFNTP